MSAVEAKRTLVKSPPEVWAKVSDPEVLADHLADLGPVRITHVEPESVVLWEGDRTSGAVHLEAGGWGTKVRLTAELEELEAAAEPEVAVAPEPEPEPEPVAWNVPDVVAAPEPEEPAEPEVVAIPDRQGPPPREGFFARWFRRRKPEPPAAVEPEPAPEPPAAVEPEPEPEPVAVAEPEPEPAPTDHLDPQAALAVLEAALDRLGAAHHRPFSRG